MGARTMGREGELLSLCGVDVNVFNKWHDLYLQKSPTVWESLRESQGLGAEERGEAGERRPWGHEKPGPHACGSG